MNNKIDERLKRLLELEDKDIQYILNASAEILQNPVVMFDTTYKLLAYTEGVTTDDPLWNELVSCGTFSLKTVDFFREENFIKVFAESETLARMISSKLKYNRIDGKLFNGDNMQIGNICIVECNAPIESSELFLIETLCEILSHKLTNSELYGQIEGFFKQTLINRLLDAEKIDKEMFAEITGLYEDLKPNLFIAVADISFYENTLTHLAYFKDVFRRLQGEYKYYVHGEYVVILISIEGNILSVDKNLGKLNEFFTEKNIYLGISSRFQDLTETKKYYREAINALNYGMDSKINHHIFLYDNYRFEQYFNYAAIDLNPALNPTVRLILNYDKENRAAPSLADTLYYYLLYGMNPALCGRALGVKKEEIIERLTILAKEFEVDFHNGDMLTNLFITIKILNDL